MVTRLYSDMIKNTVRRTVLKNVNYFIRLNETELKVIQIHII